ncbi:radical SAM protein [Microbacterium sp. KUDC0406]|uniref:radical SAM protein n=1 Tax=Microbacterium sp. KUDC0406 TaxID=2909588 RepID=UPI001F37EB50|nr:radical SAM protein [Microbacterium sp. KUDC0406]UJP10178.1 radical SAM protein [Microbacterium sp. KUDC0406]
MTPSAGTGMPLRDYRVHRYVNAFCPRCHEEKPDQPLSEVRRLSGWLADRDGTVWLERGCPEHGLVSTMYDENAEILRYLEQWTAPTKVHTPDTAGNFKPVPQAYEDGLPEMQTQHTCILLEDITDHCNLKCPTCFAESSPALAAVAPLAEVLASVDAKLGRENDRIDVLMLSGGEPTLYPWLEQLIEHLVARPIVRILLNSNGLRIANDDEFVAFLKKHRERVEVYLQYDGEEAASVAFHRRRRHPPVQGTRAGAAVGCRCLHHPHDDRDARSERPRDRRRDPAGAGDAVRRRRDDPACVRIGALGGNRSRRSAHAHRRTRPARSADRRRHHLAGPHRTAVQSSALLLGGLLPQGRLRGVAVAGEPDRARPAQGVPRSQPRPDRQPHRRLERQQGDPRRREELAARPAQRAVVSRIRRWATSGATSA